MKYNFKGNLSAFLCDECQEMLSNLVIRVYDAHDYQNVAALVAVNEKETLSVISEKAIDEKKPRLLGEAKTDADGNFSVNINEKKYKGQPIEIDVYCQQVPGQKKNKRKAKSVQFTITTIQPRWRETNAGLEAAWNTVLPNRFWCYILSLFDVWVICGRVMSCKDQQIPLAGVKVTAMDADWIKDDNLGDDTTDSSGRFRIYYTSRDFKQTFLSPLINVEVPIPPYNSGPDVYFKVETGGGAILLNEKRSDGQKAGRKNIGNCYCIRLCVDKVPGTTDEETPISVWTGVGSAFTIPDSSSLNDFDADGYAGTQKFAITSVTTFTGQAPSKINGHPVEYRFLISDTAGVNGALPLSASAFTKVIGRDPGLFRTVLIGEMVRNDGASFKFQKIFAADADFDADGWLDVNKSILRTFNAVSTLNPAELTMTNPFGDPLWGWQDNDALISLDTRTLTSEANVPDGAASAGQNIPVTNKIKEEKIAVRFEIREVINKAGGVFNYLPASGQTLNAMVINNNRIFHKLVMDGHQTMPCSPLSGDVKAIYTVYHPYIDTVRLQIKKNGGSYQTMNDGVLPVTNNTSNSVDELVNSGYFVNNPSPTPPITSLTLVKCTYIVRIQSLLRLHTGGTQVSWTDTDTSFYYE